MIAERDLLYYRYKLTRADSDLNQYKTIRNRVNSAIRLAKRRYFEAKLSAHVPSRKLWKNLKNLGVCGKDSPKCILDPDDLNRAFTSVPSPRTSATQQTTLPLLNNHNNNNEFSFRCVSDPEVISAIYSVKSSATGPDDVSPRFIKIILPQILHVLVHVFNSCLTMSCFPVLWKKAVVLPVPKSRNSSELSDFRPISILCFPGKVLEKLMHAQMTAYLNQNNYLCRWQSGFRARHSCETALLKVISDITDSLDRDFIAVLVLLDFSKAFDSVNHNRLLAKLNRYFAFSSTAISFIKSFLSCRSQCVRVGDKSSEPCSLSCGIPQGSILGPLIFCLFINDLPQVLKDAKIHLYADDVQIYLDRPMGLVEDCVARLNDDLERIWDWANSNYLLLNPRKSTCIAFHRNALNLDELPPILINNNVVAYAQSVVSLGINLNQQLTCCSHINKVLGKIYASLRQLRLSASILSTHMRLRLAKALVLPHFLSGSLLFSKLDSDCHRRLTVAFNDTIRFIHGLRRFSHVSPYIDSFVGCPLDSYLNQRRLKFLYTLIHTNQPNYLLDRVRFLTSSRTRQLLVPSHRTLTGERSYFVQVIRLWNSLPLNLQQAGSFSEFGRLLLSARLS